ncbi:hypothetical protein [Amycolatopsis saalfeldensis]|uniref:Uncharacterized protein n=1 Tax=Amycolatopsis saalfeldensis TaxID=394193 RepID=A0A1H8YQU9_9PSEU|nr:hypothetical protein [Amycolatopsis saalfeldensis]SEP54560.1 hypothetical protein SAMN04489732_1565 [Amycolatopsis saalfeldensis]
MKAILLQLPGYLATTLRSRLKLQYTMKKLQYTMKDVALDAASAGRLSRTKSPTPATSG